MHSSPTLAGQLVLALAAQLDRRLRMPLARAQR